MTNLMLGEGCNEGSCRVEKSLFGAKKKIFKFYGHENDISEQKNVSDKNNLENWAGKW